MLVIDNSNMTRCKAIILPVDNGQRLLQELMLHFA
jgi:hypothetical protein